MLEVMAGLVDNDARPGSRKSRITAKTPWQLGVALLTLLGAAALPARSLVLPHNKTPLDESLCAEGLRLYAAVHGLARPETGSSTGQDARATISIHSGAPQCASNGTMLAPSPDVQHTLGRDATGSALATAAPAKRAREESGSPRKQRRRNEETPVYQYRCLARYSPATTATSST